MGIRRKMLDSAIRMHSKLIGWKFGLLMHPWLELEIVLPSVGHIGIVDRRLKGCHSLCPMVWLISKVRLGDIGTGETYGQ